MTDDAPRDRRIQCGNREYVIHPHPDGVFGVYDPQGHLVLGWPETAMLSGERGLAMTDEDWCNVLARLRPSR